MAERHGFEDMSIVPDEAIPYVEGMISRGLIVAPPQLSHDQWKFVIDQVESFANRALNPVVRPTRRVLGCYALLSEYSLLGSKHIHYPRQ